VKRRKFITLIGSAVAWPIAARAQQTGRLPTVGFLGVDAASWTPWTTAFVKRLAELGWIENRTVSLEYRWNQGSNARNAEVAAEFVRLKVDVIVTNAFAVPALTQVTSVIPIVFALAIDPIGGGLVKSLARPGGNVTGLSTQGPEVAGKRLELLRAVIPGLHRLAILADVAFPQAVLELQEVRAAAVGLGLEIVTLEIRKAEDIAPAFAALNTQVDALYVVGDALSTGNRPRIMTFALTRRLPAVSNTRDWVDAGALMSYGTNFPNQFRRAAEMTDKILRGANPGGIPVEQPTKFDLVVNLTTAKALDLTVPPNIIAIADEVIE
jgi:putative ABC transport system substrate-binding protein